MAFMKRQERLMAFVRPKNRNVNNIIRQIDETSNSQNESLPIKGLDEKIYIPIYCKWINELNERFDERGNDEWFRRHITSQIKWVSLHYRCLLDTVLTVSNIKLIEWADLAEITNAFTFLITTTYFKELLADYPFTKEIVSLREKLNSFCLDTQEDEHVQFRLKFDTKKELLLQRYELASVFSKICFNQLQLNFKNEYAKQINKPIE